MAYIGSRPDNVISRNAQNEYNYTATGGQTTFTGVDSNNNTLSYTPGNIEVYFNGARLEESDFTATNGTSIVLANAAVVNDELSIVAMRVFEVGSISNFNTSDLTEGSNLYFTNARADARIAAADTDDLSEGSTNLYFTNARADARIAAADTDDLSEGSTNLYFTNARVAGYLSSNDFDTATNIVASITDSAPSTLDTLNELAAALGDDANFSTTVTNSIATKLPLSGGTLTGDLIINTSSNGILKLQEGGADKGYIGAGGGGLYIKNLAGDVIFRNSSDADTIRIKDSGNVGIGTTSPSDKLEVSRTSTDQTVGLTLTNLQAGGYGSGIVWKSKRSDAPNNILDAAKIVVTGENSWNSDGNTASQMQFWTQKDNTLTKHMTLNKNGNLGIGTASPEHKLHVKSTAHDEPIALFEADTGSGGDVSIRLEGGASGNADEIYIEFSDRADPTNSFTVGLDDDASKLFFGYGALGTSNGHTQMVLQSDGKVGIGTTSPATLLNVRAGTNHTNGTDRTDLVTLHQGISAWSVGRGAGIRWVGDVSRTMAGISTYVFGVEQTGLAFETGGATSTGNLNPTTRMVIDHNGNVGIGNTNPGQRLTIEGTADNTNSEVRITATGVASGYLGADSNGFNIGTDTAGLYFKTGVTGGQSVGATGSARMVINSSGNVGIGTASPGAKLTITDENAGQAMLQVRNYSTSATGSFGNAHSVELRSATSTTTHGVLIHHHENAIGRRSLDVSDSNGIFASFVQGKVGIGTTSPSAKLHTKETTSDTISAATAGVKFDGSGGDGLAFGNMQSSPWSSWIQAGYLADGYSPAFNNGYPISLNPVGGNVGIGTTAPSVSKGLHVRGGLNVEQQASDPNQASGGDSILKVSKLDNKDWTAEFVGESGTATDYGIRVTTATSASYGIALLAAGVYRFRVLGNGNVLNANNSYGAISDIKLKENIADATSQWNDIKAVRVRKYSFKSDQLDTPNQLGVIAQELESAGMNGLVTSTPDIDDDKNLTGTSTKEVKYSVLYMKAIKALQEAMTRIETLESEVAALKE